MMGQAILYRAFIVGSRKDAEAPMRGLVQAACLESGETNRDDLPKTAAANSCFDFGGVGRSC